LSRFSDTCLAALVFVYSLNVAPMMFESFTSDRIWARNPPDSFYMFLGPYGQQTAHYWRVVSPLALAAFILSLIFNWHVAGRKPWLILAFIVYLAVQVSTMMYFVPEQEALISNASSISREILRSRADRWILLNYSRNAAGVLAFVLLLLAVLAPRVPAQAR
jgi:hypothetical protein